MADAISMTPENGRGAIELGRDGVRVRDSMVLELGDGQVEFPHSKGHGCG